MHSITKILLISCIAAFTLVPDTVEANPVAWFAAIAAKLGQRLVKNSWYARCNSRNLPPGINCPNISFGVGLDRNSAQNSARLYATTLGDAICGQTPYFGHCDIRKFVN